MKANYLMPLWHRTAVLLMLWMSGLGLQAQCENFSIQTETICDSNVGVYYLSLQAAGGTAPYIVFVGSELPPFESTGEEFLAGPFDLGQPYSVTGIDADSCTVVLGSGPIYCGPSPCFNADIQFVQECLDDEDQFVLWIDIEGAADHYEVLILGQDIIDVEGESSVMLGSFANCPLEPISGFLWFEQDGAMCDQYFEFEPTSCLLTECPCESIEIEYQLFCPDPLDGTAEVQYHIVGGTPPYTLSDDVNLTINEGEPSVFSVMYADPVVINLSVVDGNGCMVIVDSTFLPCIKLPIELLYFEGSQTSAGNLLSWETATEVDNDYYTILRSLDGENFEEIARVFSVGNSNMPQFYNYLDSEVSDHDGMLYYCLKQTDMDGSESECLKMISINVQSAENILTAVHIYPLVAENFIRLGFDGVPISGQYDLAIYGLYGERKIQQKVNERSQRIDVSGLAVGVYFANIYDGQHSVSARFLKK